VTKRSQAISKRLKTNENGIPLRVNKFYFYPLLKDIEDTTKLLWFCFRLVFAIRALKMLPKTTRLYSIYIYEIPTSSVNTLTI